MSICGNRQSFVLLWKVCFYASLSIETLFVLQAETQTVYSGHGGGFKPIAAVKDFQDKIFAIFFV